MSCSRAGEAVHASAQQGTRLVACALCRRQIPMGMCAARCSSRLTLHGLKCKQPCLVWNIRRGRNANFALSALLGPLLLWYSPYTVLWLLRCSF